jgi:hypothetical protein
MKKDKTPKGLISGELGLDKYSTAYFTLVAYYKKLVDRPMEVNDYGFIFSLLETLEAVAKNTKNKEAKND